MTDTAIVPAYSTGLTLPPTPEEFERTATFMAREFHEATAEIGRLMDAIKAQSARLQDTFADLAEKWPHDFRIDHDYNGHRHVDHAELVKHMSRHCWRLLVDKLGIKNIMSVARRNEFERQLESGELPPITEEAIMGIIGGLAGQARDFARDAAREVFDFLRPGKGWGGEYKTNDPFRVGKRVILPNYVERCYDGKQFRASYYHEKHLVALDGVFHMLDGKGVMREHKGPLIKAIEESPDGRGSTNFFAFKCYKNRNLHLEFRRLDLVMKLNEQATGEHVLGNDME